MLLSTEEKLDLVIKSVGDLASAVRDIGVRVYKNDMYTGEEEMPGDMQDELTMGQHYGIDSVMPSADGMGMGEPALPGEEGVDIDMAGFQHQDPMMGGDPMMGEPALPGEEELDIDMMGGMHKGYANTALQARDEEDAPFGEEQSNIKGNEPSPAGDMGGNREDETFNVNFSTMMREIRMLRRDLASPQSVQKGQPRPDAQSIVPGRPDLNKGRGGGFEITPEIEKQVKERSFQEINRLRTQVGDLPVHAFVR